MEDTALKTAVAAAVKAALATELARVSEQLALVFLDNAELKKPVGKLVEDIAKRKVSARVLLFQPVQEERLEHAPATPSPKPDGKRARDPETQQKPPPKKRREAD